MTTSTEPNPCNQCNSKAEETYWRGGFPNSQHGMQCSSWICPSRSVDAPPTNYRGGSMAETREKWNTSNPIGINGMVS